MTMRITPTQAVMGEAGTVLAAGTTYTVSDKFGAEVVGSGRGIDVDGALKSPNTNPLRVSDPVSGDPLQIGFDDYSIATVGDSITARWQNSSGAPLVVFSQPWGYLKWALELSGQRFNVVNFATSSTGMTSVSAGVTPTFQTQTASAIASGVRKVTFMGGVNDIQADATLAQLKAAALEIVNRLTAANIKVYWCTIPPMNSTYGSYTTARQGVLLAFNAWIREQCALRSTKNVRLVDLYSMVVNPASVTSNWTTGYTSDGLHPINVGAYYMGKELARVWVADGAPELPLLLSSAADAKVDHAGAALFSSSNNILQNGLFNLGTPASGVAQNWTAAATGGGGVTGSLVAHPSGFGNRQQLVITAAAGSDTASLTSASFGPRVPFTGKLLVTGEIIVSAITNLKNIRIRMSGFGNVNPSVTWSQSDGTDAALPEGWTGQFKFYLDLTNAGLTVLGGGMTLAFLAEFSGAGGCTLQVGRVSVRDVT